VRKKAWRKRKKREDLIKANARERPGFQRPTQKESHWLAKGKIVAAAVSRRGQRATQTSAREKTKRSPKRKLKRTARTNTTKGGDKMPESGGEKKGHTGLEERERGGSQGIRLAKKRAQPKQKGSCLVRKG